MIGQLKFIHVILIGFAISTSLLLSSCGGSSRELQAMLNTSQSFKQLNTGYETRRWEQDNGASLGKPEYPGLTVVYMPKNSNTLDNVFDEIIDILNKDNWKSESRNIDQPDHYTAKLPQPDFSIVVEVVKDTKNNTVSVILRTISP